MRHIVIKRNSHPQRPAKEVVDAYWAKKCIPAPRDKTLLEELSIPERSVADIYCQAIRDYMNRNISEKEMFATMGTP